MMKKALRIVLAAAVLLVALCLPAFAKVVSPGADFYYLDQADVLSQALEGEIYFSNTLLEEACGAQVVVVTVKNTGTQAIDDYAYDLFNDWGIGDASKNNGFLLLLSIGDDDYYALSGTGLRSRFSSSAIKDYYDQYLEKDFAAGNYEAGVKKFFEAVFKRVSDTYSAGVTTDEGIEAYESYMASLEDEYENSYGGYAGPSRNGDYGESSGGSAFMGFLIVVVLVVVLIMVSSSRRRRRRAAIFPPPPPTPSNIYIAPRVVRPRPTVGYRPPMGGMGFSSGASRPSSSSSTRRSSGISFGSSHSSGSSFRSSSSRSSGFGGGHSGGGRSVGGGAGRGRH